MAKFGRVTHGEGRVSWAQPMLPSQREDPSSPQFLAVRLLMPAPGDVE